MTMYMCGFENVQTGKKEILLDFYDKPQYYTEDEAEAFIEENSNRPNVRPFYEKVPD